MKRILYIIGILVLALTLAACQEKEPEKTVEETGCEIAVIAEGSGEADISVTEATWKSVKAFADEHELAAGKYEPEEASEEAYLKSIQQAVDDGAGFIVLPGRSFETTAYKAQTSYADTDFLLIDGVPHDAENNYATGANTVSVVFAEEEAGYLAGYAAVKDGYTKLGFVGGKEIPAIKRFGYGFVQGAASAAEETGAKVELAYKYAGTFEESDEVKELAAGLYKDGTEVIFACGGLIGNSVVKAAEEAGGKVIGADVDQSGLSDTVITSAEKGIDAAVTTVLKSYVNETFVGGTAFNYAAKNDGVMLETANSGFKAFDEKEYKKVFDKLKAGKIELKKDTGASSVSELAGELVTIKE